MSWNPPPRAPPLYVDKCLKMHMIHISFSISQLWMCPRSVFVPPLTPALTRGEFPLRQHNSPKNWIVTSSLEVKDARNPALYPHCKKWNPTKQSGPQMHRETQLRATSMIALSAATCLTFSCFSYQTHMRLGEALHCNREQAHNYISQEHLI